MICLVTDTDAGILLEVTDQRSDNSKKIKKFLRHCRLFLDSDLPWDKKLSHFKDVPQEKVKDFSYVKRWKYVYLCDSIELIEKRIEASHYPEAKGNLFVFGPDDIEYLKLLSRLIGRYARSELLSALGFSPKDFGQRERIELEFLKLENRALSKDVGMRADIFLLEFSAEELLTIGKVSRYVSLEDPSLKGGYQRVLIPEKLKSIAIKYLGNDPKVCFPNTVTLVLSEGCKEDTSNGKPVLLIPNRYASVDIIDGQHRIFAYADPSITNATRTKARVLASAIKFETKNLQEKNRLAARTFWTINSRQASVRRDLLYLIKYDVLGDDDPPALAGEILRQCNDTTKALGQLFKTNQLRKKNRFDLPPIPITTIVEELGRMLDFRSLLKENSSRRSRIESAFGEKIDDLQNNPKTVIAKGRQLLEVFFGHVSEVMSEDWKGNSKSNLLSANYIAAMIRLFRHMTIENGEPITSIKTSLLKVKTSIRDRYSIASGKATFGDRSGIPAKKMGVATIYKFLLD